MSYVVVIFGGPADGWCDLNHCPMEAIGPFETHEKAMAEAARFPDGFQPHVLDLRSTDGFREPNLDHGWERRHETAEQNLSPEYWLD